MRTLKTIFRNLRSSRISTIFDFVGLITAFTAFILIMLYVWTEYSFDSYHHDADNIYRLELKSPEKDKTSVYMAGQTKDVIREQLSDVVATTTYMPWGKWDEYLFEWTKDGQKRQSYEDYAIADKYLTDVFTFDFLHSAGASPLADPNSAIVSDAFAVKLWGTTHAMDQTFTANGEEYTVTGVFRTPPKNSLFDTPVIMAFPSRGWIADSYQSWGIINFPEFIKVKSGVSASELQARINTIDILKEKYDYLDKNSERAEIIARPLSELRFAKDVAENPLFNTNNQSSVNMLFVVGLFILMIAVLNYVNFATATLPKRMKNIGVRRILGNSRRQILMLNILESVLVSGVSFLVALGLAIFVNHHFGIQLFEYSLDFQASVLVMFLLFAVALAAGVLGALVPAFGSIGIAPMDAIKKRHAIARQTSRGWLTVVQFVATILLIAMSVLTMKQVDFMKTTSLGFDKENVMVISPTDDLLNNLDAFKSDLQQNPLVETVALSSGVPGIPSNIEGFRFNDEHVQTWLWFADGEYMKMMDFNIVEGRGFLRESESEQSSVIINEAAKRKYGLETGSHLTKYDREGNPINFQVVGIIEDFNFVSLRENIEPFTFRYYPGTFHGWINIKLAAGDKKTAVDFITQAYSKLSPNEPIRYYFLDDKLNLLYAKEDRQVNLIFFFSLLSLVISVLGILGLSIFTSQYRTKEIGIRKINGATIAEILALLNKGFIKWIVVAFVIATPIAYYAMSRWLENFAYKTALSWWIFVLAGLIALIVALLTVSWQSWRAASHNPVEALRYE
ncbi:MAG: ABC transporter permease [Bacteroidales bacterium]|jgi:putative ABC transport system permease protein|nr:ABC transporter permease [Bacteroidales bacterium]